MSCWVGFVVPCGGCRNSQQRRRTHHRQALATLRTVPRSLLRVRVPKRSPTVRIPIRLREDRTRSKAIAIVSNPQSELRNRAAPRTGSTKNGKPVNVAHWSLIRKKKLPSRSGTLLGEIARGVLKGRPATLSHESASLASRGDQGLHLIGKRAQRSCLLRFET